MPGSHVHGVAAEDAEEGCELLDLGEGVLGADVCHGGLEVDVEHILEVLGRAAQVGVVHDAHGTAAVWAALDLGQADIPEGEG